MTKESELGRIYKDGEVICLQGEKSNNMYVIQSGRVEVIAEEGNQKVLLAILEKDDIFGEMSLFDTAPRSATVKASGEARVLSIDKRGFLRRVHEDPSLAFRLLQKMSQRIRDMNSQLIKLKDSKQ